MEFGYDLTALTADFDLSRPLKYFFWVETRSWGKGAGKIHNVSIIDYTLDRDGVEVPFELAGTVDVPSAGKKTELTAIVSGDAVPAPRNLYIADGQLHWETPTGSRNDPASYNIYHNGDLLTSVPATSLSTNLAVAGSFAVSAVYRVGDYDVESKRSAPVAAPIQPNAEALNQIALLQPGTKLVIPNLIERSTENFTIEFWLWMNETPQGEDYGFRIKADTTTFFFKITKGNYIELGQDGGSYTRFASGLRSGGFRHIAIVGDVEE
jgi:hypothetical protein